MRILLVYCNLPHEEKLPIGICQVAACLKNEGFDVDLFETTYYREPGDYPPTEYMVDTLQAPPCCMNNVQFRTTSVSDDFVEKITEFKPDLIGFSVLEATFRNFLKLLHAARDHIQRLRIPVVVGGTEAMIMPQLFETCSPLDYICIGEGEQALVELCRRIEEGRDTIDIGGFWVRQGRNWKKNPRTPPVDLDSLPPLDTYIFKSTRDSWANERGYVEVARGCPHGCSFCSDDGLKAIYRKDTHTSWYRKKSIARIEHDLVHTIKTDNPDSINLCAPSFLTISVSRLRAFVEMYKKYSLPFWFFLRPDDVTEEKLSILREIDCDISVGMGLEQGNEAFRRKVLNRNYSNNTVREACALLRDYDIFTTIDCVFGFPHQSREMIFDSVRLLRDVHWDSFDIFIFSPLHGTRLRQVCIDDGMVDDNLITDGYIRPTYALKNNILSEAEILGLARTLPLYIVMDERRYPEIRQAEALTPKGNRVFETLRSEYYQLRGWA